MLSKATTEPATTVEGLKEALDHGAASYWVVKKNLKKFSGKHKVEVSQEKLGYFTSAYSPGKTEGSVSDPWEALCLHVSWKYSHGSLDG